MNTSVLVWFDNNEIHYLFVQDYFTLLDSKCPSFKNMTGGGVGWFAHIYSEDQEPGYGVVDGNMKFTDKRYISIINGDNL